MEKQQKIKIGTRGSKLALYQANEVKDRLIAAHGEIDLEIEILVISTSGDRIQDKALRDFGGKGLFTKEIEEALIDFDIDLAVHSMKDVQTLLPEGLLIPCILPREDVRDAFISLNASSINDLKEGAVVGTASLRRQAQVKQVRPDLKVVNFRGSVETRLQKIAEGVVDATFLAVAGLNRLGLSDKITSKIPVDVMLPAVAQGAIGVECRADDAPVLELISNLNHLETQSAIMAERSLLRVLDGSCRTPIAAIAEISDELLRLRGQILAPDGSTVFTHEVTGDVRDALKIGVECGDALKRKAGSEFMAMLVK